MDKKVAILVSCYNHEKFVFECIKSILAQTYKNWVLYFVDNSSTDGSLEVASSFLADIESTNDVTLVSLGQIFHYSVVPIGIARWMAVMQYQSSADYIAILDADDYWHPEKLEKQMAIFERDPEVKLVFSDCFYDHFNWEWTQDPDFPILSGKKKFGEIQKETFHDRYPPIMVDDPYYSLLTRYSFMPCPTLVFEKNAFMDVIGPPTHYTSAEDYDWILKMTAKYKCDYVPEPLAYYRVHSEQLTQKTSTRCTMEEIDVVKRTMYFRSLSKKQKVRIYAHILELYMKLIYKEALDVKKLF